MERLPETLAFRSEFLKAARTHSPGTGWLATVEIYAPTVLKGTSLKGLSAEPCSH